MQVAQVGVERPRLAGDGAYHSRVRVPHARNVVVHVEVPAAVGVEHPRSFGGSHLDRGVVAERLDRRPEHAVAPSGEQPTTFTAVVGIDQRPANTVVAERQEVIEHGDGAVVVALGELGFLQTLRGTPRRDRNADRQARGPQVAHDIQLVGIEWRDALVPVEHQPGDSHEVAVASAGAERVEHRSDVAHQRGVAHVAEVDNADDAAGVVDEGVVDGEVAMHDLGAQRGPPRCDCRIEAIENPRDGEPGRRNLDRGNHCPAPRRVLHVPWHGAHGPRVDEAAQGAAEARRRGAPGDEGGVVEGARIVTGVTRDQAVHARPVGAAFVMPCHAMQRISVGGAGHGPRPGDGQPGVDTGDVFDRGGLHVERVSGLGGVGDLHHGEPAPVGVEQHEGAIAFAAQVTGGGGGEPEPAGDVAGIGERAWW